MKIDIPDDHVVRGNSHMLMQVFLNLLENAIHATSGVDAPEIRISSRKIGDECVVTVTDNGHGIPPEVADKIFDPFFTTKDVDEGMGMGLSFCYATLVSWGGNLMVSSEPGQTSFVLTLPTGGLDPSSGNEPQHDLTLA